MSKLDEWAAPTRVAAQPKSETKHVRTSISWTADYPDAVKRLTLEAQQGTGQPSFNASLTMRAAIKALDSMTPAERLRFFEAAVIEREQQ